MSLDNRTDINDCEATTGWGGDDAVTVTTLAGQFFENTSSLSTQLSNVDEHMFTTEDTASGGVFSLDWSDSTLYMIVKDNLQQDAAAGGIQFVIGDTTNRPGYDIGGRDAPGMPLSKYFFNMKLDVSVIVTTPGVFTDFAGTEVNMDQTKVTQVGYGSIHAGKAQGPIDNVFMDAFRYIDNDSYALTITGGTVSVPETMTDVVTDDVAGGWGMVSNPVGDVYYFGAPTEWGEASASTNHYFNAEGEQWYLFGNNGGGHALGATHFPFRVISNATASGSFTLSNVSIVNIGTRAEFLFDSADFEILDVDSCFFTDVGAIEAPLASGIFTNNIFTNCDRIDHNGGDMSRSSVILSNVAADEGALFYNQFANPDGELDDMSFTQGATDHHAIRFGTNVPSTMTLRGCDFTGFSASDDVDGSVFRFDDTSGAITLNLVGCTNDGSGFTVDDAAGVTVTVVVDPVTTLVHADDDSGSDLQNARVVLEAADGAGDFPFEESVTITRSGATATVAHTTHGLETGDLVIIRGAVQPEYNGPFVIIVTTVSEYTYTVSGTPDTPATGTIISSGAILSGLTDVNGDISTLRTFLLDTNVKGVVRKSSASPRFKSFPISGTVDNVVGLTINIRMVSDE